MKSETSTKYPYHILREFTIANPRNMPIKFSSGYPTGVTITMSTAHPISDSYASNKCVK